MPITLSTGLLVTEELVERRKTDEDIEQLGDTVGKPLSDTPAENLK
jgi:hypothetical protein